MAREDAYVARRAMTKSVDSLHEVQTLNLDSPDENTERADVKTVDELDGDLLDGGSVQEEGGAVTLDGKTVSTTSLPGAWQN
eukprot:SAG31_NODE_2906_length_4924_cov_4.748187_4_plen_82_part_00